MGFIKPKTPKPPPLPPPPKVEADDTSLSEDRELRKRRSGRASTLISDIANQTEDANVQSRISKLLG